MYEQKLFKIVEPIKKTTISRLNKGKKWEVITKSITLLLYLEQVK